MRGGIAAIAVVALAFVTLVPNAPTRVPSEDAGIFFYAARALLTGGTPYMDVWDHKPPLVYAIDAVGLALAGPTGVWIVQIVFLSLAALIGLHSMTRAFGIVPALFGTFAWLVAAPRLFTREGEQTSFVEFYALLLQFAAIAIVTRHLDMRLRRRDALAVGALGALAFMLKPTLIGTWLAIFIVIAWRQRFGAVLPTLVGAVGAAVVLATVAAFFASRNALDELVEQVFRYNVAYASFTPLIERLGAIPEGVRLASPSGLAPLAGAAALYAIARRRFDPIVAVAIVAVPIELALSTSGRAYHYYFLPWLPAMGVLAGFAASEARSLLRAAGPAAIAVALVLMSIQPIRLVGRLAEIPDDGVSRAAAAYVSARTQPNDSVLVWGSHGEVLILADRRSPTRYVYQYAALATRGYATPAAVDSLVADLVARPPVLIVDASATSFVTPPLDRAGSAAWTSPEPQYAWPAELEKVLAFVETNYVRESAIPGTQWPVWRRR